MEMNFDLWICEPWISEPVESKRAGLVSGQKERVRVEYAADLSR